MSRALQEVANQLDEVPDYPDDVDRPVIRASDTASDDAIAYCLLQAEDPDFEVAEFYDYADRYLKPALERIPGVAEIGIYGGREHQVQVQFDPVALAQRGISMAELRAALQSDNVNESAGDMANGRQDVRFRVLGQFDSLDPLRRTIVKYDDHGVPIRVEDVADVELVLEKKVHFDQCKGRTSMTIFVKRETGTNVLDIMRAGPPARSTNSTPRAACCSRSRTTATGSACGWSSTTRTTSTGPWGWCGRTCCWAAAWPCSCCCCSSAARGRR